MKKIFALTSMALLVAACGNKEKEYDATGIFEATEVTISANREGLLSLASHLIALAGSPAPDHFHLDGYNALEDGSAELIVEKTE